MLALIDVLLVLSPVIVMLVLPVTMIALLSTSANILLQKAAERFAR